MQSQLAQINEEIQKELSAHQSIQQQLQSARSSSSSESALGEVTSSIGDLTSATLSALGSAASSGVSAIGDTASNAASTLIAKPLKSIASFIKSSSIPTVKSSDVFSTVTFEPRRQLYCPVSSHYISEMKIYVTDSLGKPVDLNGIDWFMTLLLRHTEENSLV